MRLAARLGIGTAIAGMIASFASAAPAQEAEEVVVFVAKTIVTMDPGWPEGTAVAVRDGRILSVGRRLDDLAPWLDGRSHRVDRTFEDKVLLPGFVEAHRHPLIGGFVMTRKLTAYKDIPNPYGPVHKGVATRAAALAKLVEYDREMQDPNALLLSFGFDSLRFGGHLTRAELDRISTTRPIAVLDNSQHFTYANSSFIERRGYTAETAKSIPGAQFDASGELNGQFLGTSSTAFVLGPEMAKVLAPGEGFPVLDYLVDLSRKGGITTQSELVLGVVNVDAEAKLYEAYFNDPERPMRVVAAVDARSLTLQKKDAAVETYRALQERSTDRLLFRGVKAFSDDSFTAYGMVVKNPGYTDGREGFYINDTPALVELLLPYWKAGAQIHVHSNGNGGQDNTLAALTELQRQVPRFDHRFTMQHFGLFTTAQARRVKELGVVASLNPYYLRDWGEFNERFLGVDRAHLAARFRTLTDLGVTVSMHSDTPVGPALPLEWVWIAVNRLGESGRVLGPEERVSVEDALKMVTINAAYTLGVEDKIGSIEPGKLADFVVLDRDPRSVAAEEIRDIPVWGTVVGGKRYPAEDVTRRP